MKLTTPLLAALEVGLNRYLALDPTALAECERLLGRCMAVHLRELDLTLYLTPVRGGLQLGQESDSVPDAWVETSVPAAWRLMAANAEQRQALVAARHVVIEGDSSLAEQVFRILRRVDFDPEELLANVVGDVVAHRVGVAARELLGWSRGTAETLGQDAVEYLREETGDLVHGADLAQWMDAVDALNADTDRLEARVRRLERRVAGA